MCEYKLLLLRPSNGDAGVIVRRAGLTSVTYCVLSWVFSSSAAAKSRDKQALSLYKLHLLISTSFHSGLN